MTQQSRIRIGTRSSALALWQANHVASLLSDLPGAPESEVVKIKTEGDIIQDAPLWAVDGKMFFTKEIDEAQRSGKVDIAVHSLKDVATSLPDGLVLGAVLEREDPRDVLITRSSLALKDLPPGASVGTSSLRRRALLSHIRPDLELRHLRGNVPTRIQCLEKGDFDAIILAAAGVKRLGMANRMSYFLGTDVFPPAVSQGAIGIIIRDGDTETQKWIQALDHRATRIVTTAERSLLAVLEGGCHMPLGTLATIEGDQVVQHAVLSSPDGVVYVEASGEAPTTMAKELGQDLARKLLNNGGDIIIRDHLSVD